MLQKVVICGVDTSGLPLLSAKEQEELMVKLKAGDEAARERFIVGNSGRRFSGRLRRAYQGD